MERMFLRCLMAWCLKSLFFKIWPHYGHKRSGAPGSAPANFWERRSSHFSDFRSARSECYSEEHRSFNSLTTIQPPHITTQKPHNTTTTTQHNTTHFKAIKGVFCNFAYTQQPQSYTTQHNHNTTPHNITQHFKVI